VWHEAIPKIFNLFKNVRDPTQHKSQFSAEKYVYENIWIVPRKHEKLKFGKLGILGFASTQKKKVRPGNEDNK